MKLLLNITFLLCLSQYAAALVLWPFGPANKRSHDELNQAEVDERSLVCKLDAVLLACKVLGAQATTFCSSYLHISTSTSVVFTTTPTYVLSWIANIYITYLPRNFFANAILNQDSSNYFLDVGRLYNYNDYNNDDYRP